MAIDIYRKINIEEKKMKLLEVFDNIVCLKFPGGQIFIFQGGLLMDTDSNASQQK